MNKFRKLKVYSALADCVCQCKAEVETKQVADAEDDSVSLLDNSSPTQEKSFLEQKKETQ